MEERIESLLSQMTLEEKVAMTAGSDNWHTTGVERLGVPAIKVSDGPNGARGGLFVGGTTAACAPVGIALAATWNTDLVGQVGDLLADEAKTKGARMLLAPTVNMHRSPLNGRNFECYSEDPYLASRVAVAYIGGLQAKGVSACIKHFVCNDSEYQRNSISSEVTERPLRELYLAPFEAAVKEAHTWAVMSAYNKINGVFACQHDELLNRVLKQEWGFDGVVVSDWFGTKSTVEAAVAGLDLEMPGPPRLRGQALLKAVEEGAVPEAAIDEAVRRILRLIIRVGALDDPTEPPERAEDRPEHRAVLRRAAAEGIVLLKNEGNLLPLDPAALKSLAVIGPNAKDAKIMGGGSARVNAHYRVSPYEGLVNALGDRVELRYALGCTNYKLVPTLRGEQIRTPDGAPGVLVEYFDNAALEGPVVRRDVHPESELIWFGSILEGMENANCSARLSATFTPEVSGPHHISLVSVGLSRLFLDGEEIIDNWAHQKRGEAYFGAGSEEVVVDRALEAGRTYQLRAEFSGAGTMGLAALRVGVTPVLPADAVEQAAATAAACDAALLFIGLSDEWESEGYDRPHMDLPEDQVRLVEAVAAANPNTIVVLQTGSPVTMPWLDRVPAVLEAWYPGQECGNAIADVLLGAVNPAGRLPQTFPKRLPDNPAYINYPGENGKVHYGEGLFIGYRYYDKKEIEPLFPFGHGLSYTTFRYSNLRLAAEEVSPGQEVEVAVDITNTGERAGQEVVQLYVADEEASLARPPKELKGFAKVMLEPGETRTVTFRLGQRALAFFDDARRAWVAEPGAFRVLVGASAADIREEARFVLTDEWVAPLPGGGVAFGLDTNVRDLLAHPQARRVLEGLFGPAMGMLESPMVAGFSLRQLAAMAPDQLTEEVLAVLEGQLSQVV